MLIFVIIGMARVPNVNALASDVPDRIIRLSAPCEAIDPKRKQAIISGEVVPDDRLIVSAPLPIALRLAGQPAPDGLLTANKVLVSSWGSTNRHFVHITGSIIPNKIGCSFALVIMTTSLVRIG